MTIRHAGSDKTEDITIVRDKIVVPPLRGWQRADNGQWQVRLRTPGAGGPHTITVAGHNTITLEDVMIGEVWVCSGQSNMEWPITHTLNSEAEIAAADHPNIRLFDVKNTFAIEPQADCEGAWVECSPETIKTCSAVGYFFGRELHQEFGVPI